MNGTPYSQHLNQPFQNLSLPLRQRRWTPTPGRTGLIANAIAPCDIPPASPTTDSDMLPAVLPTGKTAPLTRGASRQKLSGDSEGGSRFMEGCQLGPFAALRYSAEGATQGAANGANTSWRPRGPSSPTEDGMSRTRAPPLGSGNPKGPDWPFGADEGHGSSGLSGSRESSADGSLHDKNRRRQNAPATRKGSARSVPTGG